MPGPLRHISCYALCMIAVAFAGCSKGGPSIDAAAPDAALDSLDKVVLHHALYVERKNAKIDSLSSLLNHIRSEEKYDLADAIYGEYNSYDLDSAALYALTKAGIAADNGDRISESVSLLNLAIIRIARGDEIEAIEAIGTAARDTANPAVKRLYYDAMEGLANLKGQDPTPWMAKLSATLDSTSSRWVYNESNMLKRRGKVNEAIAVLNAHDSVISSTPHKVAITSYLKGLLMLEKGDTTEALKMLTHSTIHDLMLPVRDYASLYVLAELLAARGDTERAYRYITFAANDAESAQVLFNMRHANRLIPTILRAHEREQERAAVNRARYAIGISVLTLVLAVLLMFALKSRNIAHRASARSKALNEELSKTNEELAAVNLELRHLNDDIKESSEVKDAYIVQYFNLCSYYIGRLEQFRSSISAAARTKGLPGVEKAVAELDDDKELRDFYANFDATFLRLFPSFVDRFNELLIPECRITLKSNGSMPNELRTFALIRLGVTDSTQIAAFLRRSVTTIYNYRVKMRNSAAGDRDEFEAKVAKIPQ